MLGIKSVLSVPDTAAPPAIRQRQATTSDDEAQRVGRFARDQAHDFGNLLIGITFCLKRLRGCQRTEELEEFVEQALQAADHGVEAGRALLQATHMLMRKMAAKKPGRATT